jgi:hypothetical protein
VREEEAEVSFNPSHFRALVDVLLDGTGYMVQRILHTPKLPPYWYSAIVFCLGSQLITFGINIALGENDALGRLMIGTLSGHLQTFLSLVITSISARQLIAGLCLYIPDATKSAKDLADFQCWLTDFSNSQRALWKLSLFCIPLAMIFVLGYSLQIGAFAGFGIATSITMSTIVGFSHVYYAILFLRYSDRLANYDFELFEANPSDSKIIHNLARLLDNFAFLTAANQTLVLIVVAFGGLPLAPVAFIALIACITTLTLFVTNHRTLSKIIQRAKWNTLIEVQTQIKSLQSENERLDKDTLEYVQKLLTYHDYVKHTPNSALNISTAITLGRSLLLPTGVFLISNFETIRNLFSVP